VKRLFCVGSSGMTRGDYRPRPMAKISFKKCSCKFPVEVKRLFCVGSSGMTRGDYHPRPTAILSFEKQCCNFSAELKRLIVFSHL
ncbi:MAG: hypothetical protein ACKOYC_09435, partial [Bacteroidota bacterium]